MNGIHDMGGMHGFGSVVREENEPVFHEAWEGRVFGMLRELSAQFPPSRPGLNRDIIEHIPPARYLAIGYYERFLEVLEQRALAEGVITKSELDATTESFKDDPARPVPSREEPNAALRALGRLRVQAHPEREGSPPRFAKGDSVIARNLNWAGHNRLPRYIRGKPGLIERVNGLHAIEDAHAEALGPDPQTVYTVAFTGSEVWGQGCEANLTLRLELWECYLDPAR